jgi:hypothetical protein
MSNLAAHNQSSENKEFDADAFWGLKEESRFPLTQEEWDLMHWLPGSPPAKIVGEQGFDLFVNDKSRRPVTETMAMLFSEFRENFEAASEALKPTHWRLLFYLDQFPMAALGQSSFDPVKELTLIVNQDSSQTDVPIEWIGSTTPVDWVLQDIRILLYDTDVDLAKALWAILAFARSLGLEKNEVLQVKFWECWWIDRFLKAAKEQA